MELAAGARLLDLKRSLAARTGFPPSWQDLLVGHTLLPDGESLPAGSLQGGQALTLVVRGPAKLPKTIGGLKKFFSGEDGANGACATWVTNAWLLGQERERAELNGALAVAAAHAPAGICRLLIAARAEADARDEGRGRPLGAAAGRGDLERCRFLLDAGASANAADWSGGTPLHLTRDLDVARLLLDAHADVSATDKKGQTPLHAAAARGDLPMCRRLLEARADAAAEGAPAAAPEGGPRDQRWCTPLHHAAHAGNDTLCRLLLAARADAAAESRHGTPWQLAEWKLRGCRCEGVCKYYMSCGAGFSVPKLEYTAACRTLRRAAGLPPSSKPPAWRPDRLRVILAWHLAVAWHFIKRVLWFRSSHAL